VRRQYTVVQDEVNAGARRERREAFQQLDRLDNSWVVPSLQSAFKQKSTRPSALGVSRSCAIGGRST
jgi:hypothetical protein